MSGEAHGGLHPTELRALGLDPAEVLDFSVNVNPYGPAPGVRAELAAYDPSSYPDREVSDLRASLAHLNGVDLEQVVVGNGTAELIWLAAHAFLRERRALIIGPTFGEYERAASVVGAQVEDLVLPPPDFAMETTELLSRLRAARADVVFLCNPNNPTGGLLDDTVVLEIADACAPGLLILDEAYRAFVTLNPFGPLPAENCIVMRSMTKDFAIPGVRLGYALAAPEYAAQLLRYQPPWSVSGTAQAAGKAGLAELDYLRQTLGQTRRLAEELQNGLRAIGAQVVSSSTHYCLVDVSSLGGGTNWRRRLLPHGLQVRDCTSFGLPDYVRVGARLPGQNHRLLQAWQARMND
jgi:histidinol-phosphate/aromatic aminotransferase/cobyric acid decarboxylase-like protein